MSKITVIVFLLFSVPLPIFSQNNLVSGIVIDSISKLPVSYATIYLTDNPEIGTYSDSNGKFNLFLEDDTLSQSGLNITAVGYKHKVIPNSKNPIEVVVSPISYTLDDVVVISHKLSNILIGPNKNFKLNYNILSRRKFSSLQTGIVFANQSIDGKLNNARFYAKCNKENKVKGRLQVYSIDSKRNIEISVSENIIFSVNSSNDPVDIDLSSYNIFVKGEFMISFEFFISDIDSVNDSDEIETTLKFTKCNKKEKKNYYALQRMNNGSWVSYNPIPEATFVPYIEVSVLY